MRQLVTSAALAMGKSMSEQRDFALKPGAQPGDSAFPLNSGRHQLAFDPFPGRFIVLAFLGLAADPAAEAALSALSANRSATFGRLCRTLLGGPVRV